MEYVDRVLYAHSIDTGDLDYTTVLINNFDQIMGIYGFIQPCDYQLKIIEDSRDDLVLDISFSNGDSALKIASILASFDNKLSIYGRVFTIGILNNSIDTLRLFMHTEQ